jgi:hypothetical protein
MFELALGLTMYREALNDTAAHSDEWPPGFNTNLGELDYAAEILIREVWAELSQEKRRVLLLAATNAVRDHLEAKKGPDNGP